MEQDKIFLDPNLTLSQTAQKIACPASQLTQVTSTQFGANFYSFVDQQRVRYARQLLLEKSDDRDYVSHAAVEAGFRSVERFARSFNREYDMTPAEFHHKFQGQ